MLKTLAIFEERVSQLGSASKNSSIVEASGVLFNLMACMVRNGFKVCGVDDSLITVTVTGPDRFGPIEYKLVW